MHARIARFEGVAAQGLDAMGAQITEQMQGEPPPGLEPVSEVLVLVDRERGVSLGIVLFPDEESLRRGDEALNAMSPGEGAGSRASVETYEVVVHEERG